MLDLNIYVELYPPLVNEEDLLCLVALVIEPVRLKHPDLLQERHNLEDELWIFVFKEFYLLDDVLMRQLNNSGFQHGRQVVYKFLVVDLVQCLLVIVLNEFPDPGLKTVRQPLSLSEVR